MNLKHRCGRYQVGNRILLLPHGTPAALLKPDVLIRTRINKKCPTVDKRLGVGLEPGNRVSLCDLTGGALLSA